MRLLVRLGLASVVTLGVATAVSAPGCPPATAAPDFSTKNPLLPNPFEFLSGAPVTTKADWSCRREEISKLLQQYELEIKPDAPQKLESDFQKYPNGTGGNLTLTASNGDNEMS